MIFAYSKRNNLDSKEMKMSNNGLLPLAFSKALRKAGARARLTSPSTQTPFPRGPLLQNLSTDNLKQEE